MIASTRFKFLLGSFIILQLCFMQVSSDDEPVADATEAPAAIEEPAAADVPAATEDATKTDEKSEDSGAEEKTTDTLNGSTDAAETGSIIYFKTVNLSIL